ncbi:hypothetical protein C2L65_25315 [Paraburkholderia terrae]|uniref:Uncharacterized protein n=2 Tax=Paraburkholderia terrae TaxID=311230 RepID=A0A2I8EVS9_9BURK|nr:hypothetical protein C2L65_25315 [Paraburkholderia terrae]
MRAGVILSGDRNQCAECGLLFASTPVFYRHRVGSADDGSRRCLTAAEMPRAGIEQDDNGFWSFASPGVADHVTVPVARPVLTRNGACENPAAADEARAR